MALMSVWMDGAWFPARGMTWEEFFGGIPIALSILLLVVGVFLIVSVVRYIRKGVQKEIQKQEQEREEMLGPTKKK